MTTQGQAFAAVVIDAFRQAGHGTDEEIVGAGGPSTSTLTKLRKAAAGEEDYPEPRNPTWRKIEKAAGWSAGDARRTWETGEAPARSVGSDVQADGYVASPGERATITLTEEQLAGVIARAVEDARRISGS